MKGKSASKYSRSERIERASDLIGRGWSDTDIAKKLKVSRKTASTYRRINNERIARMAQENPRMMQDVLANTLRQLEEYDQIRKAAWEGHSKAKRKIVIECPNCEEVAMEMLPDLDVQKKFLDTALKAQQDRAKLFGTMGVKAEFMAMVSAVKRVQDLLLTFMARELCVRDRETLIKYLDTPEMRELLGTASTIDAESWEVDPAQISS